MSNRLLRQRLAVVFAAVCLGSVSTPTLGATLEEAMASAYSGQPALLAQRARLRATDEQVSEARAGFRPSLIGNVYGGRSTLDQQVTSSGRTSKYNQGVNTYGAELVLSQPLFSGGRTVASIDRAQNLVQAERASLINAEQRTLIAAVEAYVNVYTNTRVDEIARENERVLTDFYQGTESQHRLGQVTRTDIALAASRLAGARASRLRAEADLANSRSEYQRVVGALPVRLEPPRSGHGSAAHA